MGRRLRWAYRTCDEFCKVRVQACFNRTKGLYNNKLPIIIKLILKEHNIIRQLICTQTLNAHDSYFYILCLK